MLPQEMGCGSGVTCWRRLHEWQEAGVWERLHKVLLDRLGEAEQIDMGKIPKSFEKDARPLPIHCGFIGKCFADGARLDMYTLSLLGDSGAGGALGNSR